MITAQQLAGALLIVGSVIFWLGAALPTWRAYATDDPELRARIITDRENYWIFSHFLFLVGAVATTSGMAVFTSIVETVNARPLAIIGLVALALGTLVWAHIIFAFRLLMLAEEYAHTTAGAWTFPIYTVLTLGGLILYGIVLLLSGFPTWLGLVTIGLCSLILLGFFIQKDTAPPLFYIPTLIIGIVFLL